MSVSLDLALQKGDVERIGRLAGVSRTMAAKALTFTAQKAVPAWIVGNSVFHKRRTWIDRGVRSRPATASDLTAVVGTLDRYMGRHVKGIDEEKAADTGKSLFVPIYNSAGDVGTHTQVRRQLARFDQTQRKTFVLKAASGKVFIARRTTTARAPLQIVAVLEQEVDIKPALDALGIVSAVVNVQFGPVYERLLLRWNDTGKT